MFTLVGFPQTEWDVFSSALQDIFIPWSAREESRLRFESLVRGSLSVTKYEVCFCELSRHVMTIVQYEAESHQFVRGLTFSIRYVFRASREVYCF